ncbi:MAG: alpha/beta hydrolase [Candidatus Promineifilaceae bacterium]|nr:alpha/beta hydrolase [Candidatus Promineifilaceae bacterium]
MATWKSDDNTLINYEVYGQGADRPTLLLLPGLLGSISSQWRGFVDPLSRQFRVVLMDLRGHGHSENQAQALQIERLAADVAGLVDYLDLDEIHVAGYSLGGYLGLLFALQQPGRVPTLLMHATKFYWTEEAAGRMRSQLDPDLMAEKVPAYADSLAQEHGSRWRALVRQAGDLIAHLGQEGLSERMVRQLQMPIMVSVGDRDELVSLPEASRLSRIPPQGMLLVLPGVQHPFATVQPIPLLPTMQHFHGNDRQWR